MGPPPSAWDAIARAWQSVRAYPDPDSRHLRQVLAEVCGVPAEWILPGNGAAELLTWAGRDLSRWDAVGLAVPAFADYDRALKSFGAKTVRCRLSLEGDRVLLPDFETQLGDPSRCALLLNNPHNPTGAGWTIAELLPLVERFALVVVDEAFMDFLPDTAPYSLVPFVAQFDNLVVVRSLTKFYSVPGLRLGYAIGHPHRLQRWQQWRDPWPVNALAAAIVPALLGDTEFHQKTLAWLEPARAQLYRELTDLSFLRPLPGAANFLLVETHRSAPQLQENLLKQHRILIRDCLSFPELGDRYFRVAVKSPADNHRLATALAKVGVN